MWLHISMHDSLRMTEVQSLEELQHIISDIAISKSGIEQFEVGVVDIFEDETRSLRYDVAN